MSTEIIQPINYSQLAEQLGGLLRDSYEGIRRCGVMVYEALKQDPDALDRIREAAPFLTLQTLNQLVKVGRDQLLPELVFEHGAGWNRLRAAPVEIQRKHLTNPVTVLLESGDVLQVAVANLSPAQASQVFTAGGLVRDLGAQRAYLTQIRPRLMSAEPTVKAAYKVVGNTLKVLKPTEFTFRQLAQIMAEHGK